MMENELRIFAVVVTWRGKRWYDRCLGSLQLSSIPVTTVVVDNASGDDSVSYIRDHFPDVVLFPQNENLGFAKANNIGIKYAIDHGADYVLLLNQDAWIEDDTLSFLVDSFNYIPDTGIASPMHMNGEATGLDWLFAQYLPGEFVSDIFMGKLKTNYEINYVNAAAWLINRECIRICGGFDTNLFVHYGEDSDYLNRAKYHNFKIVVNTKARAYHDREFRRKNENQYRNTVFKFDTQLKDLYQAYGLLTFPESHLLAALRSNKKTIVKCFLTGRLDKAKKHLLIREKLKRISVSRKVNLSSEYPWLKDNE